MLGMILIVIGSVGAATGFMLWGIAGTFADTHDAMSQAGIASMVIGVVATAVGVVLYRTHEKRLEDAYK